MWINWVNQKKFQWVFYFKIRLLCLATTCALTVLATNKNIQKYMNYKQWFDQMVFMDESIWLVSGGLIFQCQNFIDFTPQIVMILLFDVIRDTHLWFIRQLLTENLVWWFAWYKGCIAFNWWIAAICEQGKCDCSFCSISSKSKIYPVRTKFEIIFISRIIWS